MRNLSENAALYPEINSNVSSREGYSNPPYFQRASERASKQASKRASKQASEQMGRWVGERAGGYGVARAGPRKVQAKSKPKPKPKPDPKPEPKPEPKRERFEGREGFDNNTSVLGYALDQLPGIDQEGTISVPGPLGNKFFLKTPAQCKDIDNNSELVDRSLYFNNIPDGDTAFMPSGFSSGEFPTDYNLMPSLWSLNNIDSSQLYNSLSQEGTPECMAITLETIDQWGNQGSETANLTVSDIKGMNPCWFPNNENPLPPHSECTAAPPWKPPKSEAADAARAAAAEEAQHETDSRNQARDQAKEKRDKDAADAAEAAENATTIQGAKDQINKYRDSALKAVESITTILNEATTAVEGINAANDTAQADMAISSTRLADVVSAQDLEKQDAETNIVIKSWENDNVIELDPVLAVKYSGFNSNGVQGCYSIDSDQMWVGGVEGDADSGRESVVIQGVGKGWDYDNTGYREFKDLKWGDQCKVKSISLPPNIEAKAYTASFGWDDMCNQEVLQTVPPGAIDYEFTTSPCAFLFTEKQGQAESNAADRVAAETIAAIGAGAAAATTTYLGNVTAALTIIKDQEEIVNSVAAAIPVENSIDITNMDAKKSKAQADKEAAEAAVASATKALEDIGATSLLTLKAATYAKAATRSKITITGERGDKITMDVNKATTLMGAGQLQRGCFSLDQDKDWKEALKTGDTCAVKSIALPLNVEAKLYSGGGGKWNDLCTEGEGGRNLNMDVYAAPGLITKFENERPCGFLFTKVDPVCPPEFCAPTPTPDEGFTNLHPALYNEEDDLYTFFSYLYYFSLLLLFGYIIKRAVHR
jgi:hypothetical protein